MIRASRATFVPLLDLDSPHETGLPATETPDTRRLCGVAGLGQARAIIAMRNAALGRGAGPDANSSSRDLVEALSALKAVRIGALEPERLDVAG